MKPDVPTQALSAQRNKSSQCVTLKTTRSLCGGFSDRRPRMSVVPNDTVEIEAMQTVTVTVMMRKP